MQQKLTVVMPVYNGMPYLPQAVDSILKQTYSDFQLVILNDGSKDGSGEYLRTVHDPRVVLIEQENRGQGATLNHGLRIADSEYVAYMDADDISLPDRLRQQVEFMDAHPDVVLSGTQLDFLAGEIWQAGMPAPTTHEGILARLRKGQAGFCHPSMILRRDVALAVGGYPTWTLGLDIEFCLLMCEAGKVANLDKVLYQYRFHEGQTSTAKFRGLVSANRWAARRAVCRAKKLPEPTLEEFLKQTPFYRRWQWSAEAQSTALYRRGRMQIAKGNRLRGLWGMMLAGLCTPTLIFRKPLAALRVLAKAGA